MKSALFVVITLLLLQPGSGGRRDGKESKQMRENVSRLISAATGASGGLSIDNMKKLHHDLLKGYNRDVRPVKNQEKPVIVYFGVAVVEVAELSQDNGRMSMSAWLRMSWTDEMLRWGVKQYGGITKVMMPANKIWLPDIRLYNGLESSVDTSVSAQVESDGTVTWITPARYTLTCRHEFRHNAWACPFTFSSWTYNRFELDIAPWPGRDGKTDFDVEQFRESDYYAVVDHKGARELKDDDGFCHLHRIEGTEMKSFSCCREPYPAMQYLLKIKNQRPSLTGQMKQFSCCREPYPAMEYLLKLRNNMGPSLLGK